MICYSCEASNPPKAKFCIHCGCRFVPDPATEAPCRSCQAPLPNDARFCGYCGTPDPIAAVPIPTAEPIAAEPVVEMSAPTAVSASAPTRVEPAAPPVDPAAPVAASPTAPTRVEPVAAPANRAASMAPPPQAEPPVAAPGGVGLAQRGHADSTAKTAAEPVASLAGVEDDDDPEEATALRRQLDRMALGGQAQGRTKLQTQPARVASSRTLSERLGRGKGASPGAGAYAMQGPSLRKAVDKKVQTPPPPPPIGGARPVPGAEADAAPSTPRAKPKVGGLAGPPPGPAPMPPPRSSAPPKVESPPPGAESKKPGPRTVTAPQKAVYDRPNPSEAAAILAPPEGWPDITDELAEVRFSTLQGLDDDVKIAVYALRDKYPGHPDVESLAAELGVELEGTERAVAPPEAFTPAEVSAPEPEPTPQSGPPPRRFPVAGSTLPPSSPPPSSSDEDLGELDTVGPGSSLIDELDLSGVRSTGPVPRLDAAAMLDEDSGPLPAEDPDGFVDRTMMVSGPQPPAPYGGVAPPEPSVPLPAEDEAAEDPLAYERRSTLAPGFGGDDESTVSMNLPGGIYDEEDDEHSVTLPPGQLTISRGVASAADNVATYVGRPPTADDEGGEPVPAAGSSATLVPDSDGPPAPAPYEGPEAAPEGMKAPSREADTAAASGTFRVSDLGLDDMPDLGSLSADAMPRHTEEGTVVARSPVPPAPFGQSVTSIPVAPVRLVMLGPRGEAVAERRIELDTYLDVGRQPGEPWADDRRMETHHARLFPGSGGVVVDDFGQPSGVYTQIVDTIAVDDGDELKVGQARLALQRVSGPGTRWGQLTMVRHDATTPETIALDRDEIIIGREEGDIVLPNDTFVSGDHCRFLREGNAVYVEDLGSSNGTYIRVRAGQCVAFGGLLLIGHTQFRVLNG